MSLSHDRSILKIRVCPSSLPSRLFLPHFPGFSFLSFDNSIVEVVPRFFHLSNFYSPLFHFVSLLFFPSLSLFPHSFVSLHGTRTRRAPKKLADRLIHEQDTSFFASFVSFHPSGAHCFSSLSTFFSFTPSLSLSLPSSRNLRSTARSTCPPPFLPLPPPCDESTSIDSRGGQRSD